MKPINGIIGSVLLCLTTAPVLAETPLSAIDWLSDTINDDTDATNSTAPNTASTAATGEVTVQALGKTTADAAGLIPATLSGLPADLWSQSRSSDIIQRLRDDRVNLYPAMQELLYLLLLSELDPPIDTSIDAPLFLARIDTLLALGALDQAEALMLRTGTPTKEIFRRAFDTSLLLRREDGYCQQLKLVPDLSPTFQARIFCLARLGDWNAAALTLETARALNFVDDFEDELLVRFLDPSLAEDATPLEIPTIVSPLIFRMMEAIGEPIPTRSLPRAFAHADLHANSGWRAQIEAAERLTRTSALGPNLLAGVYSENQPAASGGVWERVLAFQELEAALSTSDQEAVAHALPRAWKAAKSIEIEVQFANLYSRRLSTMEHDRETSEIVSIIRLLDNRPATPDMVSSLPDKHQSAHHIVSGQAVNIRRSDPYLSAISDGLTIKGVPIRLQSLMSSGRIGEALLRAMEMFENGSLGDVDEMRDSLQLFRAVGLDEFANRAAVQFLLLERYG